MRRPTFFVVCVAGLWAWIAGAQPAARKEPVQYTGPERASRVEARPPGMRFALRRAREFVLAPLSASESARLAEPGIRLKVGIHRALPSGALQAGAWETAPDGTPLWRMTLRSPGAQGIRVEFHNFSVGTGKVWVEDGADFAGPYSGRGLYDDGHFWSGTIFSSSVTIEYQPASDASPASQVPFEIRTIAHEALTARGNRTPASLVAGGSRFVQASAPAAGTADPADYCHLDPNCYPDWQSTMKMVGQLTFEDAGDSYFCSGSLIGTRDNSFKPYLLTAGHCIHDEAAARSLEVYWAYQTASCGAPPPTSRDNGPKSTLGADLVASGTIGQGDYSLVLLKDVPSGVTFAGWDIADPPIGTPLVGIHHPVGSYKRISFGTRTADETADVEGSIAPANLYLEVTWDKGRTEPGSSGSAIFTSPGVIVGTLTYGPASPYLTACEISPSTDGYGRFSNTYQYLKDYLEDLPAAQVTAAQSDVQFSVLDHSSTPGNQSVQLTTQSKGQVTYRLRADAPWIVLSQTTGTVSAGSPAQVTISVDPAQLTQPDQYTSTVTILSGSAAPQFINVTANVRIDQSNVVASIAPNPVYESNGQYSFAVQLAETGGAATQLKALRINGTDYSQYIQSWFGTNEIGAGSTVTAPLQGSGAFPGGTQYFEFWGVDEGSGQPWYRTATVRFVPQQ
ncbi:MAG TPA: hypothetical protein VG675_01335 [Bryobacteraceae bacterium]|nr:hypothetical protein [Bryobacteraceae bacterium]